MGNYSKGHVTIPTYIASNRNRKSILLEFEGFCLDAKEYGCGCSDVLINNEEKYLFITVKPPSEKELFKVRSMIVTTDKGEINHPIYWTVIDSDDVYINGVKQ